MSKVNAIKKEIKIASFVSTHTLTGLKQGRGRARRYFTGLCPFHQADGGKRPQFWVDVDLGLCNCFNPRCASDKPMDVINFYARIEGLSLEKAIEELYEEWCSDD